jgi:hypothetical protein
MLLSKWSDFAECKLLVQYGNNNNNIDEKDIQNQTLKYPIYKWISTHREIVVYSQTILSHMAVYRKELLVLVIFSAP